MNRPTDPPTSLAERSSRRRAARTSKRQSTQIGKSRNWLLAIAILQILVGIGFGFMNSRESDKALQHLEQFEPDEPLTLEDGTPSTARELRAAIERERVVGFVVPVALGLAFVGLWVWAKRAALPAMVCALLLFVTLHGIEAAIDPKTLVRGVVVKVFFIAALVAGIKAALQQRIAERANADDAMPA